MQAFSEFLTSVIATHGLLAVFLLMTAESALIPIPSEVTMPFAGFLAGRGLINFPLAVVTGALGNLTGSLLAYWLGFVKGEDWVRLAIKNWGRWFLVKESDFDKGKLWLEKHGHPVVFFSRLLPIVRTYISLPAGIAKNSLLPFSFLTFTGSLIWSGILAYLGLQLGQNWTAVEPYFRKFQILIALLIIAAVFFYLRTHLRRHRYSA